MLAVGVLAVLLGLVATVVLIVWITGAALVDQSEALSENLGKAVDDIKGWLASTPISADLADQAADTTTDSGPALAGGLATGAVSVINSITGIVTGTVLAMIVLYYMLKDGPTRAVKRSDPVTDKQTTRQRIADDAVKDLRSYFRGQTGIALMNGLVVGVALRCSACPPRPRSASSTSSGPTFLTSARFSEARSPC